MNATHLRWEWWPNSAMEPEDMAWITNPYFRLGLSPCFGPNSRTMVAFGSTTAAHVLVPRVINVANRHIREHCGLA